ncbi:hypothetical protein ABW20_dc0100502 [Dactylellina cionopaga]|nr:hypothetical protein ABW20_dc0100502 [Dactylellina cionopaga]
MSYLSHFTRRSMASPRWQLTAIALQSRPVFQAARLSTSTWLSSPSTAGPPEHLNEKEAGIFTKLAEQLNPSRLDVRDISGGCGSMYAVEIESPQFRGLTTLKMHRQVQDILAEDIKGWHGIQLKTKATPASE